MIGTNQLYPLTRHVQIRMRLHYMAQIADYQEVDMLSKVETYQNAHLFQLLVHALENNALELVLYCMDFATTQDVRLTFEATRVGTKMI